MHDAAAMRRFSLHLLAPLLLLGPPLPAAAQQATDTAAAVDTADRAAATPRFPPPPSTLGGAARHVVLGFSSDLWANVTAPLRMDGEEALAVGAGLGAVALIAVFDDDIQRAVVRHREDDVPRAIEDVGEFVEPVALMGNTNVYYAGGMVLAYVTGQDELRHVFEELLYSHWIASLTRKGIGRTVGRLRPHEAPDDPFARDFWAGTSFPSGHSSTATQVAAVLAHHIDWWPADAALYALAGTVVYHRVATGKHWASDSVLGALWGYAVAQIVIARREAERTDFVPFFDPGSGAVGIRVAAPF